MKCEKSFVSALPVFQFEAPRGERVTPRVTLSHHRAHIWMFGYHSISWCLKLNFELKNKNKYGNPKNNVQSFAKDQPPFLSA